VPVGVKKKGLILSFETASGVWETWKYTANLLAGWSTLTNWSATPIPPMAQQLTILRNGATLPILNNTAQTLTFPASESYVFWVGGVLYNPGIPDTGAVVSLTYGGSTAQAILWDITAKTFLCVPYSTVANYKWTHVIFATYRISSAKAYFNFACPIPYTTSDGFDIQPQYMRFSAIRSGRYYPIVDNLYKTITFPAANSDYVFYIGGKHYTGAITTAGATIALDSTGTSAKVILWDIANKTFLTVGYSSVITYALTHIIVATYRYDVDGKFYLSMPDIPYVQDDKFMGAVPFCTENKLTQFVKAINHRGFSTIAPENTLSAIKLSKRKGYNYVEVDVRWTSDNVPVLLHDTTINRTSNSTGNIIDLTLATVKTYDFGLWKNAVYTNERIPTFDEFILLCKKLSIHAYIHINTVLTDPQVAALWAIVVKYGMKKRVTWLSYESASLVKVLATDPTARCGWFIDVLTEAHITAVAALKTASNDVFASSDAASITAALVAFSVAAGIYTESYLTDVAATAVTMAGYGVDGMTTADLNIMDVLTA